MKHIERFVLNNGVRILVEPVDFVHSAAIGVSCSAGSRHELANEEGITHFIEHMLFKGTQNRTAKDIAEGIEGKGGVLNAFTDKEQTCYYCRTLDEDVVNGIDTLCDMVINPLLEKEEIEREKGVVLEEIKRSEDDPSEHVHEEHISLRWGNHVLGKPIIGTSESVSNLTREMITHYMDRLYKGGNIIVSVAGNVEPLQVKEKVEALFGNITAGQNKDLSSRPQSTVQHKEIYKDVEQVHFCIGTDVCSIYDEPSFHVQILLDAILGSGMSSRLFQEVREKRGLVYSIGSYNSIYTAGGLFTVYGGTSLETWPLVQEVVLEEFKKLTQGLLLEEELARVKASIKGHMSLGLESMNARMLRMTRNELFFDRQISIEETLEKIQKVTTNQIIDLAQDIFSENRVSTTAIGPFSS